MPQSTATYFPELSGKQKELLGQLEALYPVWNEKINVISRKDIGELYERHILHSLAIAQFIRFLPGSRILDVGTGGGFPGIPLAIMFPESRFTLVDSVHKKIRVVEEITAATQLKNVASHCLRAEKLTGHFDFVVCRAVTRFGRFVPWVINNISANHRHNLPNGIICLKGGDLSEELIDFPEAQVTPLSRWFSEPFFQTKKIVYLPLKKKKS